MWLLFTMTAPVGRELHVDRLLTILAMSMKYSCQLGRNLGIDAHSSPQGIKGRGEKRINED
jgi:hypothetical protein